MAETPEQYRKRISKSGQFWDGMPMSGYRAFCIHCGAKNRVQKRWSKMTCGNCGEISPCADEKTAKEFLLTQLSHTEISSRSLKNLGKEVIN